METCWLFVFFFFTVTLTDFDVSGEVSWKIMRERKENKFAPPLRHFHVVNSHQP